LLLSIRISLWKCIPRTLLNYAKLNCGVKLYYAYCARVPNCFQTCNMSLSTYSTYRPCSLPRSSDSHIFEKPYNNIMWGTEIKYCNYYRNCSNYYRNCTKTFYNNNNILYTIIYYLSYQLYHDRLGGAWVWWFVVGGGVSEHSFTYMTQDSLITELKRLNSTIAHSFKEVVLNLWWGDGILSSNKTMSTAAREKKTKATVSRPKYIPSI